MKFASTIFKGLIYVLYSFFFISQDAVKEHFSTFGTVTKISMEKSETSKEETTLSLFALVTFDNRIEAERVSYLIVLSFHGTI